MSRRETLEKRKNIKQTTYFFVGGIFFLFFFLVVGIPLLIDFSAFLSNILSPRQTNLKKNTKFIQQPVLEIPFEATNSAQISFSGYGAVGVDNELFVNDKKIKTVSDKNGSFTFSGVILASGDNEIYVVSKDKNSDVNAKSSVSTVTFDNKKPEISFENLTDGQEFRLNNQVTIKGKLSEEGTLYLNDSFIMVNSDKTFSVDLELKDGENVLKFKAIDKAGNTTEKEFKVNFRK